MHGIATGIEIGEADVTAVQVGGGLSGRRILACARVPLDEGGLEGALHTLAESMELKDHPTFVAIPDDLISFRNVALPFRDEKKIRQALPFEVEGTLPYPVEDLVFDFVPTRDRLGGTVLAASIRRDDLSRCLESLRSNGIDPEVLEVGGSALASWLADRPGTPDHFLVLEGGRAGQRMVLCLSRGIALIRSFVIRASAPPDGDREEGGVGRKADLSMRDITPFITALCGEVHRTLHAFMVGEGTAERPERVFFTGELLAAPQTGDLLTRWLEMPAEPIDVGRDRRIRMEAAVAADWEPALMNGALSLLLRNPAKRRGFNFRRNEFAKAKPYQQIRKAAPKAGIFLFLFLSLLAADLIIDTYSLTREYQLLDQEIQAVFRQTLPQVTRIVDPVQQLRVAVEEMKRASLSRPAGRPETGVLDLLREISARIPPAVHARMERLVVDPETVRLSGRTDAFNDVDRIKNELAEGKMFGSVAITSANLDRNGKQVQFEIAIERKR